MSAASREEAVRPVRRSPKGAPRFRRFVRFSAGKVPDSSEEGADPGPARLCARRAKTNGLPHKLCDRPLSAEKKHQVGW
jgi:hypothetical protein